MLPHRPGWSVVHQHEIGQPCTRDAFFNCYYTAGPTLPFRLLYRRLRRLVQR